MITYFELNSSEMKTFIFNIYIYVYIYIYIYIYIYTSRLQQQGVHTSDVNDAEPRLLVFNAEPRLPFSGKKTSSSRAETLAKRARAEPRL